MEEADDLLIAVQSLAEKLTEAVEAAGAAGLDANATTDLTVRGRAEVNRLRGILGRVEAAVVAAADPLTQGAAVLPPDRVAAVAAAAAALRAASK